MCKRIYRLDEIVTRVVKKHGIPDIPSHADYIILCRDKIIIVEEKERADKKALDQIGKTKEVLNKYVNDFKSELNCEDLEGLSIVGIVHSITSTDIMISKMRLRYMSKYKLDIKIIRCRKGLKHFFNKVKC